MIANGAANRTGSANQATRADPAASSKAVDNSTVSLRRRRRD
ncbi:unnamed protein product [[Actinomadura] parvosata subsp. kistnae]|nr:unnamed protein product [Actinomadura parvosata subsp. kistnae]